MTNFLTSMTRALTLTPSTAQRDIHLHGGPNGAYVCEHAACNSPALDPADA